VELLHALEVLTWLELVKLEGKARLAVEWPETREPAFEMDANFTVSCGVYDDGCAHVATAVLPQAGERRGLQLDANPLNDAIGKECVTRIKIEWCAPRSLRRAKTRGQEKAH
jgi:hypothetical protein